MPKIKHLEVCVMPNGEVICLGKTIGWVKDLGKFLFEPRITIPISAEECEELQSGGSFDWNYEGIAVHVKLEEDEDRESIAPFLTQVDHEHTFEDQGATTDSGEKIQNCTDERCSAYKDASGAIVE